MQPYGILVGYCPTVIVVLENNLDHLSCLVVSQSILSCGFGGPWEIIRDVDGCDLSCLLKRHSLD